MDSERFSGRGDKLTNIKDLESLPEEEGEREREREREREEMREERMKREGS
jgi:hypothetical protein